MKKTLLLLGLALICMTNTAAADIPPGYHDNQEIYDEIVAWQQLYPDSVRIDTIGYSQQDGLPIWAVKLSDNVHLDEDEATVLLVGQVHAEELIGVEITLALITEILEHRLQYPWKAWLQELELWIVPTLNPEGHEVVMTDSMDNSFRKNKRDCNLNGEFDYASGTGGDIDGVDLNRNFPLNWAKGDTFLQPGGNEYFDYFRGFSPLAESEMQTIWSLAQEEKFSFSVVYHASRTTNFSESIYYPWGWADGTKTSPDFDVIDYIAQEIQWLIPRISSGFYQPVPTANPAGNQHDSFYAHFGTLSYLIEAGEGIQKPDSIAQQVVADNLNGVAYILNRACGYAEITHSQLTGIVTDANNPLLRLPAEVIIPQLRGGLLQPRTCDETYGRYRRYVMPGTYDIEVRMRGYYPQTRTGIFANPSGPIPEDFTLVPKPDHLFNGDVRELGGGPLACTLFIFGEDVQDTLNVAGDGYFSCRLPEGDYELIFDSPDHVIRYDQVLLDQNWYIEFQLSSGVTVISDDFEGGLGAWTTGGTGNQWIAELADSLWSGVSIAASSPHLTLYQPQTENWIEWAVPLDLSGFLTASLQFDHWYYFEPDFDSCLVQVSTDGGQGWESFSGPFAGQDVGWGRAYGNLTPYCGESDVRLRWTISSDTTLNEQGWRIDDVVVLAADTVVYAPHSDDIPNDYTLYSAFPNPFNAELTVLLDLSHATPTHVSIWDVTGRCVSDLHKGLLVAGQHRLTWKAQSAQPSGIYLLRIEGDERVDVFKVLYLK
jgi:hypothetical protein